MFRDECFGNRKFTMTAQELFIVLIRITGLWIMLYGGRFLLTGFWYLLFYVPPTEKDLDEKKSEIGKRQMTLGDRLAYFYWGPIFVFFGFALMEIAPEIARYFK
jgi:hypothetical protein